MKRKIALMLCIALAAGATAAAFTPSVRKQEYFVETKAYRKGDHLVVGLGSVKTKWSGSRLVEWIAGVGTMLGMALDPDRIQTQNWIRLWAKTPEGWRLAYEGPGALYDVLLLQDQLIVRAGEERRLQYEKGAFKPTDPKAVDAMIRQYDKLDNAFEASEWETRDLYPYGRGVTEETFSVGDEATCIQVARIPIRFLGVFEWNERFAVKAVERGSNEEEVLFDHSTKWDRVKGGRDE